jgi:U3 small nucleolar RNA-associated protein 12
MGSLSRKGRERVTQLTSGGSGRLLGCLSGRLLELYLVRSGEERERVRRRKKKKMQKKKVAGEDETGLLDEASLSLTAAEEIPFLTSISSRDKIRSFDIQSRPLNQVMVALGLHSNSIQVHMLDMETTPPGHTLLHSITAPGHRTDVRAVCFSGDDRAIASGSANSIKIWSRSSRSCLHTMESGHVLSLTFVPGDQHIVVGTKTGQVQLYEVGSGDLLQEVGAHSGAVWSVDVSPDRRGLVTGSADHDVKFWDFELISDPTSHQRRLSLCHVRTLKMAEEVLCVCHSPNGRLLAVALLDSTVKIFFTDSLKFFLSLYGHKLPVLSMDITSDSTLLATCSSDKNIRIWGLDFGDCHKSLFAHDDSVMGVKFVPDTHLLFSCGKDRVVKCWDADSFDHIMTLEGHCGEVWCLAVSRDGSTLVTGSHDHSLRLWEKTEEPLILSEEREKAREAQFEEAAAEGEETTLPGEQGEGEVLKAGRKTMETVRSAEQLMEALAVYREEKVKGQEWEEESQLERREVPRPKPHPLLVAMGDITVWVFRA